MNGYNFTDRVRKVLQIARDEAARRNHSYVGTEHVLLGIMSEGEGVGAAALIDLDVQFESIRNEIDKRVRKGDKTAGSDFPYTAGAKMMFELSMQEARELNHAYVGTEHVLLGILREGQSVGALVLSDAGVTVDAARREVRLLLGEAFKEFP